MEVNLYKLIQSLLDNFEWHWGYSMRFGLHFVDYANNFKRYKKQSAIFWTEFLKQYQVISLPEVIIGIVFGAIGISLLFFGCILALIFTALYWRS
jgi:hypothetical protein